VSRRVAPTWRLSQEVARRPWVGRSRWPLYRPRPPRHISGASTSRQRATAGDGIKLFLSCVSDEFGDYRDALRRALTRPNVEVKIQEDFKAQSGDTLRAVRSGSSFRRRAGRLDTRD
jgi:hypothetical protein